MQVLWSLFFLLFFSLQAFDSPLLGDKDSLQALPLSIEAQESSDQKQDEGLVFSESLEEEVEDEGQTLLSLSFKTLLLHLQKSGFTEVYKGQFKIRFKRPPRV